MEHATKRNKIGTLFENLKRLAIDGDIFYSIFAFPFHKFHLFKYFH